MSELRRIFEAIDRAAAARPQAEAVRCDGRSLTWAELVSRADTLAAALRERGVNRGDRVGIVVDKSVEMVVALHGIMKAGAAWVPLDPHAPTARLAFLVDDCGIRHLVSHPPRLRTVRAMLDAGAALDHVLGIEDTELPGAPLSWESMAEDPRPAPPTEVGPDDLAYVIYTSGSTGPPKGIMHTHASGLAYCEMTARRFELTPEDRVSNQAPLHFDIAIFDLLSSAVAGAATILIPEMYLKVPASFSQLLADERISVFFTVPFALVQLIERGVLESRDMSALRQVIFGGEVMPTKHLRTAMAMLPRARFHNMYGPAEVNGCTGYDVPTLAPGDDAPIPIGTAYASAITVVEGAEGELAAPGETGQLLVGGATRMRGYWNRPDLDAQALWTRPEDGEVFYRTGDLVEEMPDGNYRFLGRADRQIKSRGYRIELDEVEAAILAHPDVIEAAVYPVDHEGTQRIEAAVQSRTVLEAAVLRAFLRDRLPGYAIPASFTAVNDFPRNSSGKIDYLVLRAYAR